MKLDITSMGDGNVRRFIDSDTLSVSTDVRDPEYAAHSGEADKALWQSLKRPAMFSPVLAAPYGLSPDTSDFIEARQFTHEDVARLYRVPSYLLDFGGAWFQAREHRHMLQESRSLKPGKYRALLRRTHA